MENKSENKIEHLQEGWVNFQRKHFKEGFIDKWTGDSINDPNKPSKSLYQLNSFDCYYRLNGQGEWINKSDLFSMDYHFHYCNEHTAEEIWDNCYKEYQRVLKELREF